MIIAWNLDEPDDARRYSSGMTIVAMVGDRNLAHESHRAILATVALLDKHVDMRWVGTDDPNFRRTVESADAVWALPGTPYVNDAAAYAAITHARTTEDAGVEGIELPDHPFFVATLFQPQMAAVHSEGVHPLIRALIESAA
jgi:CTP synthase (UTP-ammonia lyase)